MLGMASAGVVSAATLPIYNNTAPLNAPPVPVVDARIFVNSSDFNIGFIINPYETYNTLSYTNSASGTMVGNPGFRFNLVSGSSRYPSSAFLNQNLISGSTTVDVRATNIVDTGRTETGLQGLIRYEGKNVTLTRSVLRSGTMTNQFIWDGSNIRTNTYENAPGVTDFYWGVGVYRDNDGNPIGINPANYFNLPFPQTPIHPVTELFPPPPPFPPVNTFESLPSSFQWFTNGLTNFQAFAYLQQTSPTNFTVQVAFVPTRLADTNITADVQFFSGFNGPAQIMVRLQAPEFDIIRNAWMTNYITINDSTASFDRYYLADNTNAITFRPSTIELTRSSSIDLFGGFFGFGSRANATYTNGMLYLPPTGSRYVFGTITNRFAAYSGSITNIPVPNMGLNLVQYIQPTNFPGRVELLADNLKADQIRVRGESAFILRTKNLVSNKVVRADAPFAIFDLTSLQPEMTISNLAPKDVRRFAGNIACYSTTWRNFLTNSFATNIYDFNVLFVEPNLVYSQPATVWELDLHGTNIILSDSLRVRQSLLIDAVSLDVRDNLALPAGANWASTNILRLLHFTNNGVITIPSGGNYGTDRTNPYAEFINHGTNAAGAQQVRASLFENTGTLAAGGGLLSVNALTNRLLGGSTDLRTNLVQVIVFDPIIFDFRTNFVEVVITNSIGALLQGASDIELFAHDLLQSNAVVAAGLRSPGGLRVSVTNSLLDAGPEAMNGWAVSAGFQVTRLPRTSSLLGTWLWSTAAFNQLVDSFWAATNRGALAAGYSNNLALGKLTLDGADLSLFRFFGAVPNSALYVDYIDLENNATNYNNGSALSVDSGFTIYFANANVSVEKLNGAAGGRFVWVSSYAGPLSSTNITYPDGVTYTFNIALASSKNIDSDGDGIVNGDDPTPIYVGSSVGLTVALTNLPPTVPLLTWDGLYNSTNTILFVTNVTATNWQVLTNLVVGPVNQPVAYIDRSATNVSRYYRVRVMPPPL